MYSLFNWRISKMIIVITGPTCTSKSKIAIEVAKKINAEIVNADAFQIYKELNIGTAKPKIDDLKKIKHHLYDFVDPNDQYSIYDYQKDARKCINDLLKKQKNIILVGGSGLYIRSVLYDFEFHKNKKIDLNEYDYLSNIELHDKLKKIDFKQSQKIHVNNRRRIIRAIQIFLENKKTKTELESSQKHQIIYDNVHIYAINMDRKKIYEKIDKRVDMMVDEGLVQEAHNLVEKYGNIQSLKAIGYHEFIKNKNLNDNEIVEIIKKDTKKYVRRQLTFIRHQYLNVKYFKWIAPDANEILNDIKKFQ